MPSDTGRPERPPSRHEHERGAPLIPDCDGWCRAKYDKWQKRAAPERAVLVERLERIAQELVEEAGDCLQLAPRFPQHMAVFLDRLAGELLEAVALLKSEQGDPGGSKSIEPHDAAHLALTRKTDEP